jgi:hypothetical protein
MCPSLTPSQLLRWVSARCLLPVYQSSCRCASCSDLWRRGHHRHLRSSLPRVDHSTSGHSVYPPPLARVDHSTSAPTASVGHEYPLIASSRDHSSSLAFATHQRPRPYPGTLIELTTSPSSTALASLLSITLSSLSNPRVLPEHIFALKGRRRRARIGKGPPPSSGTFPLASHLPYPTFPVRFSFLSPRPSVLVPSSLLERRACVGRSIFFPPDCRGAGGGVSQTL